ncbi:hypothetical protein N9891_01005 [bacterium]|nr:hypothetical protein [bacterium]
MNLRPRDYITIGMALLAILFCGYGIGFLLGEKKGRQSTLTISTPTSQDKKSPWVRRTLAKFDDELELTPSQRKLVETEIEKTYDEIQKSRIQALRHYSTHIVDLHTRLLPHLDEAQQETVDELRQRLNDALN